MCLGCVSPSQENARMINQNGLETTASYSQLILNPTFKKYDLLSTFHYMTYHVLIMIHCLQALNRIHKQEFK